MKILRERQRESKNEYIDKERERKKMKVWRE